MTQLRATHTVVPGLVHYFILSKFTPSKPFIQAELCLSQAVTYVLLLTQIICLCLLYLSVTHCKCQKTGTPSPHRRVGGAAPPPSRLRAPGSDLSLSASPPSPRTLPDPSHALSDRLLLLILSVPANYLRTFVGTFCDLPAASSQSRRPGLAGRRAGGRAQDAADGSPVLRRMLTLRP